ncbi:beta-ketoacyl-ACP synthase III [Flavobacterium gelatinilyticum]|uniref:beta-ketoacyl-ACP synthase III n=1 Tax=Flavobacterium gelatinilyticum TaxID=3003260 RepID=UPI002480206D|nr:beta-ketoacyl-ACP synthase III [Flavobacterium gelatinilyticum]
MNAVITAVGGYVPPSILDNKKISEKVETSEEWIEKRSGIQQRRIAGADTAVSDLASSAINNLIESYEVDPNEIEALILATATPDHMLAPAAAMVCEKSNLKNAFGLDVNAACSGFLYALELAGSMIESGRYKKIIVAGADKMSSIVDYEDRSTCILFGDGAGAVLLEASESHFGLMKSKLHTDGSGTSSLLVPAGGSKMPTGMQSLLHRNHYIKQDGSYVFRKAVAAMNSVSREVLTNNGFTTGDIDWVIPHQANLRIIEAVGLDLGIDKSKIKVNIQKYGNTTSATIPLCLWDFKDDFTAGQNLLITTFGAGFSWGAACIKWGVLRNRKSSCKTIQEQENELLMY